FAPDGKRLVVGIDDVNEEPRVQSWAVGSWKVKLFPIVEFPVQCCAYRPDGQMLAIAGKSRMSLVDPRDGRNLATATLGPRYDSLALAWSPDRRLVAHAGGPVISICDGRSLDRVGEVRQPSRYFLDIAFSPDGT